MLAKYAVFGLGTSGLATIDFLMQRGCDVYAWDDNEESLKKAKQTLGRKHFSKPEDWPWKELKSLVISPGIPLTNPEPHEVVKLAKQYNVEIIGDIELLYQFKHKMSKIIAITGTNGKSTTTSLINHILKANNLPTQMGGNIGVAALGLNLLNKTNYIIEISSFQLDLLKNAKFDISILLNITEDHIDRHGDFDGYINSKKRIFKGMSKIQTAIISSDQVLTRNIAKDLKENNASKVITFVTDENYLSNIEFPNLPGKHNKQNITAAFLACKELGVSEKNIIDAIKTFKPLAHRTEFVEKLGNTRFVNDSKATNAEATKPALKTYKNIYWLAGGIPKKGGLERILGDLENVKKSYLFGEAAAVFEESLKNIGNRNYEICVNLKEAFHKAVLDASIDSNENVVLLSPACSSFDEFKNFEERGEYFKKLVMELKPTGTTEVKKVS